MNGLILNPDNSSAGVRRGILNNAKSLFEVFQTWHKKLFSVNLSGESDIRFLGTHLAFFLINPLSKNHKKLFNMKYTDERRRKKIWLWDYKIQNTMYTIGKQKEISDSTGDYNHYLVTTFFFLKSCLLGQSIKERLH